MDKATHYSPLGQWSLAGEEQPTSLDPLAKMSHPIKAPGLVPASLDPATSAVPLRDDASYKKVSSALGTDPNTRGSSLVGVNTGAPGVKASEKGVLGTQHHEALHSLVQGITDTHGPEAAKAYVHHLWSQLAPGTKDYFLRALKTRGLDPEDTNVPEHKLMEEALAGLMSHAHDPLVRAHHHNKVGPLSPELDQANKQSLKRVQQVSSILTPEVLAQQKPAALKD